MLDLEAQENELYISKCHNCGITISFSRIDLERHGYEEDSTTAFRVYCPFCGKKRGIRKCKNLDAKAKHE